MKKSLLLIVLAMLLLLSGCVTIPKPSRSFTDPSYSPENLSTANLIVYVSNDVTVNEFKKSFNETYLNSNNFSRVFTDSLTVNLKTKFPDAGIIKAETDSIGLLDTLSTVRYNYMQKYKNPLSNNYVINIRKTTIDHWYDRCYDPLNNTSTNTEYCTANMLVDIYDLNENKLVDCIIVDEEQASLFSYKACLRKTVNKAKKRICFLLTNIEKIN